MSFLYNTAKRDFANGVHDWDAGGQVFKAILVSAAYVADKDHEFASSVVAGEVSGTGYVGGFAGSGRKALASRTVIADLANDRAEMDADDATWAAINVGSVAGLVIYREGTSDADSKVIAFIDSGFPVTTTGSDLVVSWNAEGVLQIT